MAIGRISVKSGAKGRGLAHANYILREDKYKPHASKLEKVEHISHGNMPDWADNKPKLFWQMADEHERKNGSVYREHILTLPRELNETQRLELVQEWIKQELGDKHPYSLAIHCPIALDGKEQPHAHLMICERELDGIDRGADTFFKRYNSKNPERGGAKKANTGLDHATRKIQIKDQRLRWGELVNKYLEQAQSHARVDMRNYKERNAPKPLNIPMTKFNLPEVKQAYQDKLMAKIDLQKAVFTEYQIMPNVIDELEHQLEQLELENAPISEPEQIITQPPVVKITSKPIAPVIEPTIAYEPPKPTPAPIAPIVEPLTEPVAEVITQAPVIEPLPPQPQPAIIAPPVADKPSHEPVKAHKSLTRAEELAQAQANVAKFDKLVSDTATILRNNTIKARTEELNQASANLDKHNRKLFTTKKWELKKSEFEDIKNKAELSLSSATGSTAYHVAGHKGVKYIDYTTEAKKIVENNHKEMTANAQHAQAIIDQSTSQQGQDGQTQGQEVNINKSTGNRDR